MPRAKMQELQNTARWKWTKWILSFHETDLAALTRDGWNKLSQDILDFCDLAPVSAFKHLGRMLPPVAYTRHEQARSHRIQVTHDQVKKFQETVQNALNQLFHENGHGEWTVPATISRMKMERLVFTEINDFTNKETSFSWVGRSYSARWPHIFAVRVAEMLETFGPLIRRCSECQTLFIRIKRQAYCSKQCSQRARARRWYAAHKNLAKEKRRLRYEQKIRKEHPRAKVQRRAHRRA